MAEFKIKFYGVRGSYPVPGRSTLKYGGNTSCIKLNINNNLIILDAGTGIVKLGTDLVAEHLSSGDNEETRKPIIATILFSHMHHDHNQGFPFFKPAYISSSVLHMFGPTLFQKNLTDVLSLAMLPPFFPVELLELNSLNIIQNISDSNIILINPDSKIPILKNLHEDNPHIEADIIRISMFKNYAHPKTGVLIYKIQYNNKTLVYSSDVEGYIDGDQRLIRFAQNADILIHDSQYTKKQYSSYPGKQGFGHSTPGMAIDVATKANVKKLILFHHDPENDDEMIERIELGARKLFQNTMTAYEGLELEL